MSFDPEKVDRLEFEASGTISTSPDGEFVSATDYDELLALYRAATDRDALQKRINAGTEFWDWSGCGEQDELLDLILGTK